MSDYQDPVEMLNQEMQDRLAAANRQIVANEARITELTRLKDELAEDASKERQRAEAAEAELAAIPYRQLYDVWHSGDDGYIIKDAEDVAVWLAKWKLKQPARE